jgi:hypothetical protein
MLVDMGKKSDDSFTLSFSFYDSFCQSKDQVGHSTFYWEENLALATRNKPLTLIQTDAYFLLFYRQTGGVKLNYSGKSSYLDFLTCFI